MLDILILVAIILLIAFELVVTLRADYREFKSMTVGRATYKADWSKVFSKEKVSTMFSFYIIVVFRVPILSFVFNMVNFIPPAEFYTADSELLTTLINITMFIYVTSFGLYYMFRKPKTAKNR